jgi:zinc/manganese transport system substrate-binding protein
MKNKNFKSILEVTSVAIIITLFPALAQAKLNVITSVTDLRTVVEAVGKDFVEASSIAKGTQDPHFIDAKPSYMTKMSHADLVVCIGLGLEDAWLNSVISGSRNPKVKIGSTGYLAVGPELNPEEIPEGAKLSRSEGDVHPEGNPHVTVDPIRVAKAAILIGARLGELDPAHAAEYTKNAKAFSDHLTAKNVEWKKRIEKTGLKRVVTYHKTLDYFLSRMGVELTTVLEPKPGIEPSVNHLSEVMGVMKTKNAEVVLIENYFNPDVAHKLKELNANVKVAVVPVSVEGDEKIKTNEQLFESLVTIIENLMKGSHS